MRRPARLLRQIAKGGFDSDVVKLIFGTRLGRLISIIVLPILTRLYSPDDFAVLATYLAVLGTISVAACLRMDVAIPIAESDEYAINLLVLALVALGTITLFVTFLVLSVPGVMADLLGNPAIEPHLWLIPFGIGLTGVYSVFQFWTTRMRRFGRIARTRVTQSALGAITMLSLGWACLTPFGLLLGNALSMGAGGLGLAVGAAQYEGPKARLVSIANMCAALRKYYKYPLITAPEAIMNVASIQIPILIIAAYAGTEAGYLFLALQLLSAPMLLVGSSVSQVFISRSAEALETDSLPELTLETIKKLLILGSGAICLLSVLLYFFSALVFGPNWARTGQIALVLAPWTLFVFVASPISTVLYVKRRNEIGLALQTFGLILRVGMVYIACIHEALSPVLAFVISGIIPIATALVISIYYSGITRKLILSEVKSLSIYTMIYVFLSALIIIVNFSVGIIK